MGLGGVTEEAQPTTPTFPTRQPDETEESYRARCVAFGMQHPSLTPDWVKSEIRQQAHSKLAKSRNKAERVEKLHSLSDIALKAAYEHIEKVQNGVEKPDRLYRDLLIAAMNHESKLDIERQKLENNLIVEEKRHEGELELIEKSNNKVRIGERININFTHGFGQVPAEIEEEEDEEDPPTIEARFQIQDQNSSVSPAEGGDVPVTTVKDESS